MLLPVARMLFPPSANPIRIFITFEVVSIRRFIQPALLTTPFTFLLTIRSGAIVLAGSVAGVRMIHLATMQALTTIIFSHSPHALREENPREKKTHLQNRWVRRRAEEEIIFECSLKKTQSANLPLSNRKNYTTFIPVLTKKNTTFRIRI
jgi:hypothetical protein